MCSTIRKWIKTADTSGGRTQLLAFYLMNTPVVHVGNTAMRMPKHAPCIAKHGRASPVHRLCIATRVGDRAVHRRWFGCARRVPPRAGSHTRRTGSMSPVITDARRCFVPCTACASVITAACSSWRRRGDRDAARKEKVSCTGCVSRVFRVGLGRAGGLSGRPRRAPDAPLRRRRRRSARCRPRQVPHHPDPGVSEGPGGGCWGVQGRPERSTTPSSPPWRSWPTPRERAVGGKEGLGDPSGGSRGGVLVDRGPPGGWRHRIRPS